MNKKTPYWISLLETKKEKVLERQETRNIYQISLSKEDIVSRKRQKRYRKKIRLLYGEKRV
jgi:hypothetical protein